MRHRDPAAKRPVYEIPNRAGPFVCPAGRIVHDRRDDGHPDDDRKPHPWRVADHSARSHQSLLKVHPEGDPAIHRRHHHPYRRTDFGADSRSGRVQHDREPDRQFHQRLRDLRDTPAVHDPAIQASRQPRPAHVLRDHRLGRRHPDRMRAGWRRLQLRGFRGMVLPAPAVALRRAPVQSRSLSADGRRLPVRPARYDRNLVHRPGNHRRADGG